MEIKTISSDVLIIGSGGAGSRAAIEVDEAGLKPLIVSKGLSFRSGCTGMAEGGYNAVFKTVDKDDSIEAHKKDTLKGGSYLTKLLRDHGSAEKWRPGGLRHGPR